MKVARDPAELGSRPRAVAIGTFDGVHLGHRRVLEAALAAGGTSTVVTFDPHPRIALGYDVELLTTLDRRLELIAEAGIEEALVVEFDLELARLGPEEFADAVLRPLGTEVVVAGADFRFGRGRSGDLTVLGTLGFETRTVPLVEGVSSSTARDLLRAGEVERASSLPHGEPARRARPARAGKRDLRRRSGGPPGGDLDRHQSALRRPGAARRGPPARVLGRPLRASALRSALAAAA